MSGQPNAAPVLFAVASSLKAAEDRARFLALTRDLADWLAAQPGFLRYELYETDSGWLDSMLWSDRSAAEAGNQAFSETLLCADFMAIVSPGYSSYLGRAIALEQAFS